MSAYAAIVRMTSLGHMPWANAKALGVGLLCNKECGGHVALLPSHNYGTRARRGPPTQHIDCLAMHMPSRGAKRAATLYEQCAQTNPSVSARANETIAITCTLQQQWWGCAAGVQRQMWHTADEPIQKISNQCPPQNLPRHPAPHNPD